MKAFFVGLLVIFVLLLLSAIGILLLPFIVVLGFFLKWLIAVAVALVAIWLVGKVTLMLIDTLNKESN